MEFKAKIHGTIPVKYNEADKSISSTVRFTKYRIRLDDVQTNRLWFDPMLVQVVADKLEYEFDKRLNKDDEKKFTIILKQKLNALDDGVHYLDINWWNKILANIIHKRYWVQKNADWFLKTILSVLIGALIATFFSERGYKQGYQEGLKDKQEKHQDTIPQ